MTYILEQGGSVQPPVTGTFQGPYLTPNSSMPNGWTGTINTPGSAGNWSISNSPIQNYWTGTSSTETTTGTNEEAGTITFSISKTVPAFYTNPFLTVLSKVGIPVQIGSIPGVTNVSSPLPIPASPGATKNDIINIAQKNFPYFNQGFGVTGTGTSLKMYNQFVAFTAGLISSTSYGPPYQPYYVSSNSPSTNIGANNAPGAQGGVAFPYVNNIAGASFALGWMDSSNNFHPYSFITGAFMQAYLALYDDSGHSPDSRTGSVGQTQTEAGSINWGLPDPRTGRFMMSGNFVGGGAAINSTIFPNNDALNTGNPALTAGIPSSLTGVSGNFTSPQYTQFGPIGNGNCFPEDWVINSPTILTAQQRTTDGQDPRLNVTPANTPTFYADPDGVVRPGDGYYSNVSTGDGLPFFETPGTGGGASGDTKNATSVASGSNTTGNTFHGRRPVILNRPFRSVGELGYVFRDLPFKTLDFFTPASADAALLDVFSLTDESTVSSNQINSVVAGQLDLNNASLPIISAVLSGGSKKDFDAAYNLGVTPTTETATLATAIANNLNPSTGPNPLLNRAGLVTQIQPALQSIQNGAIVSAFPNATDQGNKSYLEAPVRALSDVTTTRTWNLLIDVIAQSGTLSNSAQTLNDFAVQGEKRYWLHVSIDRYTGKIVAEQLEPVYE
jgi:hypothetical protein